MALQLLLIDDMPASLADGKRVIESLDLPDVSVHTCTSVAQALALTEGRAKMDIVLSDIQMPGIDGFSAITLLADSCLRFIYLTGHPDHLDQSNETDADAFLLKPLRGTQLLKQIKKLWRNTAIELNDVEVRFVHDGTQKRDIAVMLDDITHITGAKDYIHVHVGKRTLVAWQTLKGFMADPIIAKRFIQIERSTIVALRAIEEVTESGDVVLLKGGIKFNVGSTFKAAFAAYRKARSIERS